MKEKIQNILKDLKSVERLNILLPIFQEIITNDIDNEFLKIRNTVLKEEILNYLNVMNNSVFLLNNKLFEIIHKEDSIELQQSFYSLIDNLFNNFSNFVNSINSKSLNFDNANKLLEEDYSKKLKDFESTIEKHRELEEKIDKLKQSIANIDKMEQELKQLKLKEKNDKTKVANYYEDKKKYSISINELEQTISGLPDIEEIPFKLFETQQFADRVKEVKDKWKELRSKV